MSYNRQESEQSSTAINLLNELKWWRWWYNLYSGSITHGDYPIIKLIENFLNENYIYEMRSQKRHKCSYVTVRTEFPDINPTAAFQTTFHRDINMFSFYINLFSTMAQDDEQRASETLEQLINNSKEFCYFPKDIIDHKKFDYRNPIGYGLYWGKLVVIH